MTDICERENREWIEFVKYSLVIILLKHILFSAGYLIHITCVSCTASIDYVLIG